MTKVKTFKIEQKFKHVEDLYRYLLNNVEFIGKSIEVQIQKPLRERSFCITGKEKITERNILFFASKSKFPEDLGELIVFAGAFEIDIVVFFITKANNAYFEPLSWLQKICNNDTQFIVGEVSF